MISFELEDVPVNVTAHIKKFREFLIHAWPDLDNLMEHHDWDKDGGFSDDWMRLNWELLVERELLQGQGILSYFELGDQLDYREASQEAAKYIIRVASLKPMVDVNSKEQVPANNTLVLSYFLTKLERGSGVYPPFDLAFLISTKGKQFYLVPFDDLEFYLDKYEAPPEG